MSKTSMKITNLVLIGICALMFVASSAHSEEVPKNTNRLWDYQKKHFNAYSLQDEIKIGEKYLTDQKKSFKDKKLEVNPARYENTRKRIQKIVTRLAKVSDIPGLPYEVVIFDKPDVANAYCLPGGKIGVFTGIFDKKDGLIDENNDDEIAAVLGHEIAHATLRHVTRQMTTYNSVGLIGNILTMGIGKGLGDNWAYLSQQVFNTGTFLYLPGYTRKHEKEADQVGFYYLVKAGFDYNAAIDVWKRAALKAKEKGKDKTQFFDSHPASGERAKFLQGFVQDAEEVKKKEKIIREIKK